MIPVEARIVARQSGNRIFLELAVRNVYTGDTTPMDGEFVSENSRCPFTLGMWARGIALYRASGEQIQIPENQEFHRHPGRVEWNDGAFPIVDGEPLQLRWDPLDSLIKIRPFPGEIWADSHGNKFLCLGNDGVRTQWSTFTQHRRELVVANAPDYAIPRTQRRIKTLLGFVEGSDSGYINAYHTATEGILL